MARMIPQQKLSFTLDVAFAGGLALGFAVFLVVQE
jgi:hypothetical protein